METCGSKTLKNEKEEGQQGVKKKARATRSQMKVVLWLNELQLRGKLIQVCGSLESLGGGLTNLLFIVIPELI